MSWPWPPISLAQEIGAVHMSGPSSCLDELGDAILPRHVFETKVSLLLGLELDPITPLRSSGISCCSCGAIELCKY